MPGYFRYSLDLLVERVKTLQNLGLRSVLLFAKVSDSLRDNKGTEATNPNGLMQRAIRVIKKSFPEMLVITDVALDPYSSFGHDGIVDGEEILNDNTVEILSKISVSHSEAGVDVVAPSDMMDGRVLAIREALDKANYRNVGIMSYAVKYASNFYGPFRNALDSAPGFGDKNTYQMDFRNRREAIRETLLDIEEGADMIMIKPAGVYLDIIRDISDVVHLPILAYQVSGEYAMTKVAIEKGYLSQTVIYEQLISIKRAGANSIVTYFAEEATKILQ
ncbi:delta-aminolevulinic acid dehydratase [Elysia marginata]|uniref:Delta-aminolevulinic acid dehydratase n=1 Tax=Elysia marginata TaxID=1093978 RepID=A0AAV4F0K5_9GAST|nr:delta-aminolevulinic acid dehydratase [Elysia marginata]